MGPFIQTHRRKEGLYIILSGLSLNTLCHDCDTYGDQVDFNMKHMINHNVA